MKRPVVAHLRRTGYTLVEILVATTLALLLMTAVTAMLGRVSQSITESRSVLESADRLRLAETRLQMDLAGVTATVCPTLKPENNKGYFEYIEGPAMCDATGSSGIARNSDTGDVDLTVGDFDDILMFTTRSSGKPFVGRYHDPVTGNNETIQSDVAEVAWFLRGHTLHRRVLLVAPSASNINSASATGFYAGSDISVHPMAGGTVAANTLGDLTRRECRFAHWWATATPPYDVREWYWFLTSNSNVHFPTLPTLAECSSPGWVVGQAPAARSIATLDLWTNSSGYRLSDDAYAANGTRVSDDIILTNVIGFDVKAWDPEKNAYMDIGHDHVPVSIRGLGHYGQTLTGSSDTPRTYDTWSTTLYGDFWNDGIDNGPGVAGIVDDDNEKLFPPPYPIPLRGIQVKIRVFEPDSKQVREVTVEQDFLPR